MVLASTLQAVLAATKCVRGLLSLRVRLCTVRWHSDSLCETHNLDLQQFKRTSSIDSANVVTFDGEGLPISRRVVQRPPTPFILAVKGIYTEQRVGHEALPKVQRASNNIKALEIVHLCTHAPAAFRKTERQYSIEGKFKSNVIDLGMGATPMV